MDLRTFLPDVTTLLRPSVRSNIELIIEVSDNVWNIDSDPAALELALFNLAFNARDAMKDGGKLKISAGNEILKGQPEGLRGEFVALRVADNGEGMNSETMNRVFEPFFTTKAFGEGTGLGLSQVFGFAKQVGGAITVEFQPGKGTTFTLYLPASRSAVAGGINAQGPHGHGRVLVVEDDHLVAELAAAMLNELGFEAIVTHSAKEALERLSGDRRADARLHRHRDARRNQRHRACAQGPRPLPRAAHPADHGLQRTGRSTRRISAPSETL